MVRDPILDSLLQPLGTRVRGTDLLDPLLPVRESSDENAGDGLHEADATQ